jgi:hypothetical protein
MLNIYHFLDEDEYEFGNIPLAEGLDFLGHHNFTNLYGLESENNKPSDVFSYMKPDYAYDCDYVIVSSQYLKSQNIPLQISRCRGITILIDVDDGGRLTQSTKYYDSFDWVLRCHYNKLHNWNDSVLPWQFGLPENVLKVLRIYKDLPKTPGILNTFRNSHQIRNIGLRFIEKSFSPSSIITIEPKELEVISDKEIEWFDSKAFKGRHDPKYLRRIADFQTALAFGGWFEHQTLSLIGVTLRRALIKTQRIIPRGSILCQFDSWRLWESFALGQTVIMQDLNLYGNTLPVQPVNQEHYVGIDLISGKSVNRELKDLVDLFPHIGKASTTFFELNYSNQAIAKRFLESTLIRK